MWPGRRQTTPPDVDVRRGYPAAGVPTVWQRLKLRAVPGAVARFDAHFGTVGHLSRPGGFLTAPGTARPELIARAFLGAQARLFGLGRSEVDSLRLVRSLRTKSSGVKYLTFQQTDGGRLVFGSAIKVVLDRNGRIASTAGPYFPGVAAPNPVLDAAEAVAKSAEHLAISSRVPLRPIRVTDTSARFRNTFAVGIRKPRDITVELVTFPGRPGEAGRPAWRTVIEVDALGDYESIVDAITGKLLFRENGVVSTGPQGTVFTAQHPGIAGATRTVQPFTGWVTAGVTSRAKRQRLPGHHRVRHRRVPAD